MLITVVLPDLQIFKNKNAVCTVVYNVALAFAHAIARRRYLDEVFEISFGNLLWSFVKFRNVAFKPMDVRVIYDRSLSSSWCFGRTVGENQRDSHASTFYVH